MDQKYAINLKINNNAASIINYCKNVRMTTVILDRRVACVVSCKKQDIHLACISIV